MLDAVAYVMIWCCTVIIWWRVRRPGVPVAWRVMASSVTAFAFAHTLVRIDGLDFSRPTLPWATFSAIGYLLYGAGFVMLVRHRFPPGVGVRSFLDVTVSSAAIGAVTWQLVISGGSPGSNDTWGATALYLMTDMALLTTTGILWISWPGNRAVVSIAAAGIISWVRGVLVLADVSNEIVGAWAILIFPAVTLGLTLADPRSLADSPLASESPKRTVGYLAVGIAALVVPLIDGVVSDTPVSVEAAILAAMAGAAMIARLVVLGDNLAIERDGLRELAGTDPLTGLPNRRAVRARLEMAAQATAPDLDVMFIDLDDFKAINDRHGHAVGDEVLVEFARRLRDELPPAVTAARFAGDEFVVLIPRGLDRPPMGWTAHLGALLGNDVVTSIGALPVRASIGCAPLTAGAEAESALSAADQAMYAQKKQREAQASETTQ